MFGNLFQWPWASVDVALYEDCGVVAILCHIVDVVIPRQRSGAFNLL